VWLADFYKILEYDVVYKKQVVLENRKKTRRKVRLKVLGGKSERNKREKIKPIPKNYHRIKKIKRKEKENCIQSTNIFNQNRFFYKLHVAVF
jgi:hypothetical protein